MALPNLIQIAETGETLVDVSEFGRKYAEAFEDGLTREDRASDGELRRDVIARKKRFTLNYDLADQATVDQFFALFELDNTLALEVTHLATTKAYTVLMQPIAVERLLAVHGGMWEGLSVELREV